MELIPAIDIRGGRCVRLDQGDYARETAYDDDPVAAARRWEALGATRLHVVDLDGARAGQPMNQGIVAEIARAIRIPVQTSGGIRTEATARMHLESGVSRVVLGTSAVEDRSLVERLATQLGDALVVGIDARDGVVMTRGWLVSGDVSALDLAREMRTVGVRRFIYTDIARDGMLQGPNVPALRQFEAAACCPVIASGGVSSIGHLLRLRETGAEGAIVGKALYTGDLDLPAALRALRDAGAPQPSHA